MCSVSLATNGSGGPVILEINSTGNIYFHCKFIKNADKGKLLIIMDNINQIPVTNLVSSNYCDHC